jgi:hypothetical protein
VLENAEAVPERIICCPWDLAKDAGLKEKFPKINLLLMMTSNCLRDVFVINSGKNKTGILAEMPKSFL